MVGNWSGQSGQGTLKLAVSQEWINGMNWFLHAADSGKLKVVSMIFGWTWLKMGVVI